MDVIWLILFILLEYIGYIILGLVGIIIGILVYRKKIKEARQKNYPEAVILEDFEKMKDSGIISEQEYQDVKKKTIQKQVDGWKKYKTTPVRV